jgi:hypothetical protein
VDVDVDDGLRISRKRALICLSDIVANGYDEVKLGRKDSRSAEGRRMVDIIYYVLL